MKISEIFESLLLELTASEIKTKYYSDIDDARFNQIVKSDPNTKLDGNGEIKKIGKYSKILLDMYRGGRLKLEDLPKATEYLSLAYKHNVGIPNNISELGDIYNLVSKYMINDNEVDISKLLEQLGKDEYELLFNGEKWYIFKPKNKKASCILGSGTEWCTAWGEYSTDPKKRGRDGMYDHYSKQDTLYILINKEDNSVKYQFHIKSNQFMDKNDRGINMDNFLDRNEEILYFFNPKLRDLKEASDSELGELLTTPIMNGDGIDMVSNEFVRRGGNNEALAMLVDDDEYGLNKLIADSSFVIDTIGYYEVSMRRFDIDELKPYYDMNRYRHGDDYGDTDYEAKEFLEENKDFVFEKVSEKIKESFKDEGLDIVDYCDKYYDGFDGEFLYEYLFKDNQDVRYGVSSVYDSGYDDAVRQASNELIDRAERFFDYGNKSIKLSIFKVFLLKSEEYSGEAFAEFLSSFFGLTTGDYVWDEYHDMVSSYNNVNDDDIIDAILDLVDNLVSDFMADYSDDITRYHYKYSDDKETSDWYHNTDDSNISDVDYKFKRKLESVLAKYAKSNTYINDDTKTLKIYDNKLNGYKGLVYITFKDKQANRDFNGYVTLEQLVGYINYDGGSSNFYARLETILKNMGVDKSKDYFENEIVKLRINYNKVDIVGGKIWIELTNKSTNKVNSGMVSIDSLPTYFRNYKLFEEVNRIKKLLK